MKEFQTIIDEQAQSRADRFIKKQSMQTQPKKQPLFINPEPIALNQSDLARFESTPVRPKSQLSGKLLQLKHNPSIAVPAEDTKSVAE